MEQNFQIKENQTKQKKRGHRITNSSIGFGSLKNKTNSFNETQKNNFLENNNQINNNDDETRTLTKNQSNFKNTINNMFQNKSNSQNQNTLHLKIFLII